MKSKPKPESKPIEVIEGFRCVESKDAAQQKIVDEIKGMSPGEEIAYFRRTAGKGPFKELWKKAWQERSAAPRRKTP